jgi:hypothetical protein
MRILTLLRCALLASILGGMALGTSRSAHAGLTVTLSQTGNPVANSNTSVTLPGSRGNNSG